MQIAAQLRLREFIPLGRAMLSGVIFLRANVEGISGEVDSHGGGRLVGCAGLHRAWR